MSSIVYFKFKANVKTDSVPFDGSAISVKDLKYAIRTKCCLYSSDFDLRLEDTSGKEYNKDDELIPKYTSIVVRRVPRLTNEGPKKKQTAAKDMPWRELQKNQSNLTDSQPPKHVNLAESDLPEDEKIKIMVERSSEVYAEKNFTVKAKPYGVPPPAYVCHKCNQFGHWIHNCPGVRDKTGKMMDVKSVKRPTGIPQDFLLEVEAGTPGAYLSKSGKYMVPIKDAEAYALGKKDKRPFSVEENPPYVAQEERKPPKQFICPLCNKMFKDAVLVSCCGTTYCNDCIMGHVFDAQVLGSHKCPNCDAVLNDHESSVFENALVRSMIRDWLADETGLKNLDLEIPQDDIFKLTEVDKTFINNRRVLKPKQASLNVATATPTSEQSQEDTKPEPVTSNSMNTETPHLSPPVTASEPPNSNDCVTLSTSSTVLPFDSVHVSDMALAINSSIVTHNTCSTVVASAPCTTLVGANAQSLLASASCLSSAQIPCLSFPSSTAMIPPILPGISDGSNPLINALCNMRVDSLQTQLLASQTVLPAPYQGSLVGAPDWTAESALAASAAQGVNLVDPVLQVNSNQTAFGIVPGQGIPGLLQTVLSAPIETIDGHKVLSKEEFYRLKMEMLHSARRRHRHRSRSRSPGYVSSRSSRFYPELRRRYYNDEDRERRDHIRSSADRGADYSRRRHRHREDFYESRYDRSDSSRDRRHHENLEDRYRLREDVRGYEFISKRSRERSPVKKDWSRYNSSDSHRLSPFLREPHETLHSHREPHMVKLINDGPTKTRNRSPLSETSQYMFDAGATELRNIVIRKNVNDDCTDDPASRCFTVSHREFTHKSNLESDVSSQAHQTDKISRASSLQSVPTLDVPADTNAVLKHDIVDSFSPKLLSKEILIKKERRHKKHKHKHSSKKAMKKALQSVDKTMSDLLIPNGTGSLLSGDTDPSMIMTLPSTADASVKRLKKHKKHKKHKKRSHQ